MRRIREVLRLRHQGLTERVIARTLGVSNGVVHGYVRRARLAGLTWPLPEGMDDEGLELLLFPAPTAASQSDRRPSPDWAYVEKELRRRSVTRLLLWEEYRTANPDGFGYTWFCTTFESWKRRARPSMRQTHVGGEKVFVDFAGDTIDIFDPITGAACRWIPARCPIAREEPRRHVVLEMEKLPWIRTPYMPGQEPPVDERHYTTTFGGKPHPITYDDDKATWLAVLLISPSDLGGQQPDRQPVQGVASDLVPNSLKMGNPKGDPVPGALPPTGYSIFSYALEAGLTPKDGIVDPGPGYAPDEPCTYIDVPAALFVKLAPSISDLEMMAHVRAVEMDSKPIQDHETADAEQSYGLVVGNRLPETLPPTDVPPAPQTTPAIGKNVALLVSLESMQMALRGQSSSSYFARQVASSANGFVRLIVLYQWSFASWNDSSFEFEQILKALNGRDPKAPNSGPRVPNPLMRRPDPPSYPDGKDDQKIIQEMLELGYTPLNHLTRVPNVPQTETEKIQTVSWYRGPLAPFPSTPKLSFLSGSSDDPANQESLIFSADQLLRFDPNVGLYDTSYAAAWQLGRLISLQDGSFSVALYRWKKGVEQQFRMMLEDQVLQQDYPGLIALYQGILNAQGRTDTSKVMYKSVMSLLASSQNSKRSR
jgi:hypothetical protein